VVVSFEELRRGWRTLVGSAVGMGAGISLFGTANSYFIKPLHAAFGWSRGQIALSSIGVLLTSLAMPAVGVMIDRYGPRFFILAGAILFAAAYLALSAMPGPLWVYLAVVLAIGLTAGPATAPLIFTRPLVGAFAKSRGLALAFGMSGSVALSIVVQPTLQHVVATHGWRAGYMVMAPIGLACGLASFVLLFDSKPRQAPATSAQPARNDADHSLSEALHDPRFWLLAFSMMCISMAGAAFAGQMQPLLSDLGAPGRTAALLGAWYATSVVVGRLICGTLLDRLWSPGVGFVALSGPVLGLLVFLIHAPPLWMMAGGVALVGLSQGDAAGYFGLKAFGVIFGILGLCFGVAVAIGGVAGGVLFDRVGDYHLNLELGSALSAAAISLLASGLLRRKTAPTPPVDDIEAAALSVSAGN
jgi:MFS family permease